MGINDSVKDNGGPIPRKKSYNGLCARTIRQPMIHASRHSFSKWNVEQNTTIISKRDTTSW